MTGPWSSERAWDWQRARPWTMGFNFVPSQAANTTEWWQGGTVSDDAVERELGWAAGLGFTSARIFLQYLVWREDPVGCLARIRAFMAMAARHGLSLMPTLFDDCVFGDPPQPDPFLGRQRDPVPGMILPSWTPSPGRRLGLDPAERPRLRRYVQDIVAAFAHDPRVRLWDLWNEPMNAAGVGSPALLRDVFAWAREALPSQPLTVGMWTDNAAVEQAVVAESDVISFHHYSDHDGMARRIAGLRRHDRPLICSEWMARPAGSRIASDLPLFAAQRVDCYQWGLINGRTQCQFPWWNRPNGDVDQRGWFHDLLHADGTAYRSADLDDLRTALARIQS